MKNIKTVLAQPGMKCKLHGVPVENWLKSKALKYPVCPECVEHFSKDVQRKISAMYEDDENG